MSHAIDSEIHANGVNLTVRMGWKGGGGLGKLGILCYPIIIA